MSQTASRGDFTAMGSELFVSFELGWSRWRLAFASAIGQRAWQITIPARNVLALTDAIRKARHRLGLSEDCPVFSCYEAGREGFWLHRLLQQMSVTNLFVDSSSIEVNRLARPAKTDPPGARKPFSMPPPYPARRKKTLTLLPSPTHPPPVVTRRHGPGCGEDPPPGNPSRTPHKPRRQGASLTGLTSPPPQSGDSPKERGISRPANRHMRGIAIDLAWIWLRQQPHSD